MWLLEWLVSRFMLVYDWFGNSYWTIRAFIFSLPSLLNSIIQLVGGGIQALVQHIAAAIINFYNANIAPVIQNILNTIAAQGGIIGYLRSLVENFIAGMVARLIQLRNEIVLWAVNTYNAWITRIATTITSFIAAHLPTILAFLDFKRKYDAWLASVINKITPFQLGEILQWYSQVKPNVVAFASNPLGFIFDILWSKGIEFLCYLLGYGLGTIKYQLPNKPNWNIASGGSISPYVPTDTIFVNPVSKPYVSGYTFGNNHHGIDLGITSGEKIYASHEGIVTVAGWSTVGYGNYIDISGDKIWSRYAHLMSFLVNAGDRVFAGQTIALGDTTGNSTGDHLHFELKVNGVYVDPLNYLT